MAHLKVMSFNILAASNDKGDEQGWTQRAGFNVATIRRADPDVMGVQEMGLENLRVYREELPDYYYWLGLTANPYTFPITPMRNYYREWWPAIFWKAARFDFVAGGGFYLSRTLDAAHWYVSHVFDAHYMHPITWARLRAREDGTEFLCFNTHMHHLARTDGNRPFVQEMLTLGSDTTPILVTGDFNNPPWIPAKGWDDTAHRALLEGGFLDTYRAVNAQESPADHTFHGFYGPHPPPDRIHDPWRMDWVLVHPGAAHVEVTAHTILRDCLERAGQPPIYPSDHYPVLAELSVAGPP